MDPRCYCWRVDTVGSEESEDIPLAPFPYGLESFAKVNGRASDLGVGVGSAGVSVFVNDYRWVSKRL